MLAFLNIKCKQGKQFHGAFHTDLPVGGLILPLFLGICVIIF